MDWTTRLLRDLVAIDSVNPSLVPGATGEGPIAERIARELRAIGLDVEVQEVRPGRPNVIGVLEGRAPGASVMFCGHIDTVGVDGMERPFDPSIRDGRLFGRGAQDMKGGVAAMIGAARDLALARLPRGKVIVACVVDEEYESIGAEALVGAWSADVGVVTEPTDLQIAIGHKGFAWVRIETRGRAAHGSRPRDGRDAIARMGRVLVRLERLDRELQARAPHPVMGTGSLHASIIAGGRELSSYPDRCTLEIERRTVSGEPGETAVREVQTILNDLRAEDPEFEGSATAMFSRPPYEIDRAHALPQTLVRAAADAGRTSHLTGMSFWTDAAVLAGAGIPSVLFGPGGAGLHSTEEYVNLEEVAVCRDALARLARMIC
jgi:acetylornithine deacetylase/succinyl-diaminopimelate desuccinylase-like protein